MVHRIKINPEFLENVRRGIKKCELRLNDRDYQVGDVLLYLDLEGKETGDLAQVTHVQFYPPALRDGYVALSIYLISE